MKQKAIVMLLGVFLGAVFLTGCVQTPEESLVKQKGEASLKNYAEGQTLKETNILRQALGAPEHYKSETSDETGKLQILTDADVEIPDSDKVSAIAVSQHPFDQMVMDRITDAFFPDAEIYSNDSYSQWTKTDYQKEIEKLKGYVAQGNLDPFHLGTDENGNYVYDIYQNIETYEQEMQSAPEERSLEKVHPQYEQGGSQFWGVACQPDGTAYNYIMKTYGSMPMEVRLEKRREMQEGSVARWLEYSRASNGNFSNVPNETELEQSVGITLEEAKKAADAKVDALQLENMEMTAWEYGICFEEDMNVSGKVVDTGYMLHYTRKLNGIPITYTSETGGNLEDMNSEMESWGYELLDIIVTKDGIDTVHFNNQYDIGEIRTENLNLMSFDKIMDVYRKMMVIQNADVLNYAVSETYRIDRITFGYSRIYEPAADSQSGLLVPVWDFFGSCETVYDNEGQQENSSNTMKYRSYLTINAIDGSIIDRGLGY